MSLSNKDILELYQKSGFSMEKLRREMKLTKEQFEIVVREVPQLAVHRSSRVGFREDQVFARYKSNGLIVHADHTFYTRDGVPARNQGYGVILVVVDVLTRYAFARALKSKSGHETAAALDDIFQEYEKVFKAKPAVIQTDRAAEFMGKEVAKVLEKSDTELVHGNNQRLGAPVAERFNKTLRSAITKYWTKTDDVVWYKVLDSIISGYNGVQHSTLRKIKDDGSLEPMSESLSPEEAVWLYHSGHAHLLPTSGRSDPQLGKNIAGSPELTLGTTVRVRVMQPVVGHKDQNWSSKVYSVGEIRLEKSLLGKPVYIYLLKNADGTPIVFNGYYSVNEFTKFRASDLLPSAPEEDEVDEKKEILARYDPLEKARDQYRGAIDKVMKKVEDKLNALVDGSSLKANSAAQLEAWLEDDSAPVSVVIRTRVGQITQLRELKEQMQRARVAIGTRDDAMELRVAQKNALLRVKSDVQRRADDNKTRADRKEGVEDQKKTSKPMMTLIMKAEASMTGL